MSAARGLVDAVPDPEPGIVCEATVQVAWPSCRLTGPDAPEAIVAAGVATEATPGDFEATPVPEPSKDRGLAETDAMPGVATPAPTLMAGIAVDDTARLAIPAVRFIVP